MELIAIFYRKELEFGLGQIVDLVNYCSGTVAVQTRDMRCRKFSSIHDKSFLNYCGWLREEGYPRGVVLKFSLRHDSVTDIEKCIERCLSGALCTFSFVNDATDRILLRFEAKCIVEDNSILKLLINR